MRFVVLVLALAYTAEARYKIVGGSDAREGQFPWQGSLQFSSSGSHTCGCSVIGTRSILTAAHCVGQGPSTYQVVLGLYDLSNPSNGGNPETYTIADIVRHPDYIGSGAQGYPNDVAVITLDNTFNPDNGFIAVVPLAPDDGNDYTSANCEISGWGRLSGGGPLAGVLQVASTNVITNTECAERTSPDYIFAGTICIFTGSTGSCNGDSGGPLTCRVGGTTYLAGVTSWGIGSCDISYPSGYGRVSYHNAWITSQMA